MPLKQKEVIVDLRNEDFLFKIENGTLKNFTSTPRKINYQKYYLLCTLNESIFLIIKLKLYNRHKSYIK